MMSMSKVKWEELTIRRAIMLGCIVAGFIAGVNTIVTIIFANTIWLTWVAADVIAYGVAGGIGISLYIGALVGFTFYVSQTWNMPK